VDKRADIRIFAVFKGSYPQFSETHDIYYA